MKKVVLKRTAKDKDWTEYTDQETGKTIKLTAGVEPWTWTVETTCPVLKQNHRKILNRYIEQGIKQHEYKGGFDEAVSTLEILVK